MSEAQRIGQLFMIGLPADHLGPAIREGIARYHFGSVAFAARTSIGVAGVRRVADHVQAQARAATAAVPFFVAANQEGGQIQALTGDGFSIIPAALDQGALAPQELRQLATTWGGQLRAAGVNVDLAPVAGVTPAGPDGAVGPIGGYDREYGHDPSGVASHVAAFVRGMQAAGVSAAVKHYPGLGRVSRNTDYAADVVDTTTTRDDPYLAPFAAGIDAGARFTMISLATYTQIDPDNIAAFSNTVINGMLRGDDGFRGIVISDSLSAEAVAGLSPATRATSFLEAGGDMIILNDLADAEAMAQAIAAKDAQYDWFHARVINAAWHVLRGKEESGLLTCEG